MKFLKVALIAMVLIFAMIGVLFSAIFGAMEFGLLNVRGTIDARNNSIISIPEVKSGDVVVRGDVKRVEGEVVADLSCISGSEVCAWYEAREWEVVAGGLSKDKEKIERVARETGVSPRLIASVIVPEQIRFFTSNREVFKRYFEPLKILGSLSKFSLGVSGIKQETAEKIEIYANDPASAFYPGEAYSLLLAYENIENTSDQLFSRLTDEKDHYYSYLYTAIFIKEVLSQWERAGFDVSNEPDIVATIFNIGFSGSNPKDNPVVGGTTVTVGGKNYLFGELAGLFYNSEELSDIQK